MARTRVRLLKGDETPPADQPRTASMAEAEELEKITKENTKINSRSPSVEPKNKERDHSIEIIMRNKSPVERREDTPVVPPRGRAEVPRSDSHTPEEIEYYRQQDAARARAREHSEHQRQQVTGTTRACCCLNFVSNLRLLRGNVKGCKHIWLELRPGRSLGTTGESCSTHATANR